MTTRYFLINPDGLIEEIDDGGEAWVFEPKVPELYAQLRAAGFPVHGDDSTSFSRDMLDISVDDNGLVVANTCGAEPREHRQSAEAAAPFLAWLEKADNDAAE